MADYSWKPGAAGDFEGVTNWLDSNGVQAMLPPGPADIATIDQAGGVVTGSGTVQRLKFFGTTTVSAQLTATFGMQANQDLTLVHGAVLTTPRLGIPFDGSHGSNCTLTVGADAVIAVTPFHTVDNYALVVGDDSTATPTRPPVPGTLVVQGAGAVVDGGNQPIAVGQNSAGTVAIAEGGTMSAGNGDPLIYPWALVIGNHAHGTVAVSHAVLTAHGQIIVGRKAVGTLAIDGCSVVAADEMYIGWTPQPQTNAKGAVSVSGHRARLVVGGLLDVGGAGGTGSLDVTDHAVVSAGVSVYVSPTGALTLNHGRIDTASLGVDGTLFGSGKVTAPFGSENGGTIYAKGKLTFVGDLSNDGTINVEAGSEFVCAGSLNGGGTLTLEAGAGASLAAVAATQTITFTSNSGELDLGIPAAFAGVITGFVKGDIIRLHAATTSYTFAPTATGGVLTVKDGPNVVAQLKLIGSYPGTFTVTLGVVTYA
jgi:T5SS/PEP-CTERM-associated repeat protein